MIGVALPMDKIRANLPVAFRSLGADHGSEAARAIMTTDPFPKEAAGRFARGDACSTRWLPPSALCPAR